MLEIWQTKSGNSPDQLYVADLGQDKIALTLHIISRAGFGVSLSWPGHKDQVGASGDLEKFSSSDVPKGHDMTFRAALEGTLTNFLWFVVFSPRILGKLPFQAPHNVWRAWSNFDQYLKELLESKRSKDTSTKSKDLMARLVGASSIDGEQPKNTCSMNLNRPLQDRDITGNAFVFLVAGHETTSLSILYSCLFLAVNQAAQRRLQADIDNILNETPIQLCQYEKYYDLLSNSMVGAVINEQLRLLPPVILIPKVVATGDQTVTVDGRTVIIPNDTFVHLPTIALHRNPRYWPYQASKRTGKHHDLDDFIPERWLVRDQSMPTTSHKEVSKNGEILANPIRIQTMYSPPPGSFIPFSEGQRGCLGRRFALVEMTAALTSIFRHYSVELATNEWATEESVCRMTAQEREDLYQKAIKSAWHKLETGASARLTLQLDKGKEIPVRFVRRGKERYG